jgi:Protein of unknown function (DUF1579)
MQRTVVAFAILWVLSQLALAQAAPQLPQPGPEHRKFDYFVGHWNGEGESKESPFGPAGKFTYSEHNEWFPGGFFLLSRSEYKGAMGNAKSLATMGYDREKKTYTYHAIDSMGFDISATGTVEGNAWTWTSESNMGGKLIKTRYTTRELSPTAYSFKFETANDKGQWQTVSEGKATKSAAEKKSAPAAKSGKPK